MAVSRILQIVISMGVFIGGGGQVMGQMPGNVANEESSYLVWAVFVGAALIICATGFMNPKRSHHN